MNINKINAEIVAGYIRKQKHPTEDLYIYNYTQKAQFDKHWNEETMMCRGLILDGEHNIVARPFEKFFNKGEIEGQDIPDEVPLVFEKYDGSLGILYWVDNKPCIATRGSFTSDQARWATKWFRENGSNWIWDTNATYLFEILYKENRIVVNYDQECLVLLASINTVTGEDLNYASPTLLIPNAGVYPGHSLDELKELERQNAEGFVVYYPKANLRLKIKFDEYVRLHRLVTGVNARRIWDMLRNDQPLDEMLERVPDEFYDWVKGVRNELYSAYDRISNMSRGLYEKVEDKDRKKAAIYLMKKNPSLAPIVFKMLDGKPYKDLIWKILKPKHETPFKQDV